MPLHDNTTASAGGWVGASGTATFSHDSGSNSNRFLAIYIVWGFTSDHHITGVTYNSVSMTQFAAAFNQAGICTMQGFYLINPSSGSNTVAISWIQDGAGNSYFSATAQTFSAVHQTTPYSNYAQAAVSDASSPFVASITITSEAGDLVVASAMAVHTAASGTWTAGAGQTERADIQGSTYLFTTQTASEEAGAASVVMDHTCTTSLNYAGNLGYSLNPAAGSTATAINIGDAWKDIAGMQINIGDAWKVVPSAQINIGDTWKAVDFA